MALTLETIQELAPDQSSLKAAGKLLKPGKWPLTATHAERGLLWGECQGSGATPYRVVFDLQDHGYKCTCPSRKFPCKHVLALGWRLAESGVDEGTPPEWVEEWLTRRRGRRTSANPAAGNPANKAPSGPKDLQAALQTEAPTVSAEELAAKAERAAKAAERRRKKRETTMLAGLEELETWIRDALAEGIGRFSEQAVDRCRSAAARLVDAQCGGLARWVDELPADLFTQPDPTRARWLMTELGRITLAIEAYRRLDHLPPGLQQDVRRLVGWNQGRQELLDDPGAHRLAGVWSVLGVHSEAQVDNLVRHETWLKRHEGPEWAVLLDFMPLTGRTAAPFAPGEVLQAQVVYYPSAVPLRALLAQRSPEPPAAAPEAALAHGLPSVQAAWEHRQALLALLPWLETVPVVIDGARLGRNGKRVVLAHPEHPGIQLPVAAEPEEAHLALGAAGPATIAGLLRADSFEPLAAHTSLGWWAA